MYMFPAKGKGGSSSYTPTHTHSRTHQTRQSLLRGVSCRLYVYVYVLVLFDYKKGPSSARSSKPFSFSKFAMTLMTAALCL